MNLTEQRAKYALVNEETGTIVETMGRWDDQHFYAHNASDMADLIHPGWRAEGLKLWLRVGQQT